MTPKTALLGTAGVGVLAAALILAPKVTATHPGYWRWAYSGNFQYVPCTAKPYTMFVDPETGTEGYFTADYNPNKLQTDATKYGTYAGQMGGNHSSAYWAYNGWRVPMDAQPITGNYYPGYPPSALGAIDLCGLYHAHNTGACPVPSDDFYRTKIAANPQWQAGSNYYKPRRDAECNAPPGPTPTFPAPTPLPFPTPLPGPDPFAAWDEQLLRDGITAGCGENRFCPDSPLTREQAAVWLLKAMHGSGYVPPPCTGLFVDVPCEVKPSAHKTIKTNAQRWAEWNRDMDAGIFRPIHLNWTEGAPAEVKP